MATTDQDDDGRDGDDGGDQERPDPWTEQAKAAALANAVKGLAAYQAWWKDQPAEFRKLAASTSTHADMKAKAQEAA